MQDKGLMSSLAYLPPRANLEVISNPCSHAPVTRTKQRHRSYFAYDGWYPKQSEIRR